MRWAVGALAAAGLVLGGCAEERQNLRVVIDRGGHAGRGLDGTHQGIQQSVNGDEAYAIVAAGDSLSSLAQKHATTLDWLIRRNDLRSGLPPVGSVLIVPATGFQPSR